MLLAQQGVIVTPPIDTALNLFGIRMAHHVLRKPDATRCIFNTMHDIGHAFTKDIANLIGKPFASPWTSGVNPAAPSVREAPALRG